MVNGAGGHDAGLLGNHELGDRKHAEGEQHHHQVQHAGPFYELNNTSYNGDITMFLLNKMLTNALNISNSQVQHAGP